MTDLTDFLYREKSPGGQYYIHLLVDLIVQKSHLELFVKFAEIDRECCHGIILRSSTTQAYREIINLWLAKNPCFSDLIDLTDKFLGDWDDEDYYNQVHILWEAATDRLDRSIIYQPRDDWEIKPKQTKSLWPSEFIKMYTEKKNDIDIDDDDSTICVICMDNEREIALTPCGHRCLCPGCAERLEKPRCPICQAEVVSKIKIFL
jgi:hypothetical protein